MSGSREIAPGPVSDLESRVRADAFASLWAQRFPSAEMVSAAAAMFGSSASWDGEPGPRCRVVISPGVIAVETHDLAKLERTKERATRAQRMRVDFDAEEMNAALPLKVRLAVSQMGEVPLCEPDEVTTRGPGRSSREIREWSPKSRREMKRRLGELDYLPLVELAARGRIPCMTTLTLPDDWVTVAPTGRRFKQLIRAFLERYRRDWGERLIGVWKLEFQDRGAAHLHIMCCEPERWRRLERAGVPEGETYRMWVSRTWAEVVNHPDPVHRMLHERSGTNVKNDKALKMVDPHRMGVYFSGYSLSKSKEYQHVVPAEWQQPGAGPGRFWGYWGLEKATVSVEIPVEVADKLGRVLRRLARSQRVPPHEWMVPRGVRKRTGEVRYRKVTRRSDRRLRRGRGWLSVKDAPALAARLGLLLFPADEDPRLAAAVRRDEHLTGAERLALDRVAAGEALERRQAERQAEDMSDFLANWSESKREILET